MSEITMKTIESLPLVEEPAEDASIVGWNNGHTVRMPVGAIGGGTKGIVFTYEYDESAGGGVEASNVEPLGAAGGYVTKCNYPFEECYELLTTGSPVMFVDTDDGIISSMMQAYFGEGSGGATESIAPFVSGVPSGPYLNIRFYTSNGDFYIEYTADYLNGYYGGGDAT